MTFLGFVGRISRTHGNSTHHPAVVTLIALWTIFASALLLSGCAVKLAPDYDKAIFDGLTAVNTDAMTLFASTSSGPYAKRQSAYDSVVGQLNAVQVQIKSRGAPAPPELMAKLLGRIQPGTDQKLADVLIPPTADAVNTLVKIVERARKDDAAGRINDRIDFIQEAFAIQMAQALAYEKALLR